MDTAIPLDEAVAQEPQARAESKATRQEKSAAIPWYAVAMALGVTSIMIGLIWDIAWHRTIGRDTFWTPAALAASKTWTRRPFLEFLSA